MSTSPEPGTTESYTADTGTTESDNTTEPSQPPFDCPVNPDNEAECLTDRYPYPYDCGFYFTCFSTCQHRLDECPPGKEFNAVVKECLEPEIAECIGEYTERWTAPRPDKLCKR